MSTFFAPEFEGCICITSGDDKGILVSNINCDGSRIRNLAGATIEWALADNDGVVVANGNFVQPVDADYVTFVLPNATTTTLGGYYKYQVRYIDAGGFVTTLACGCIFIKKCVI